MRYRIPQAFLVETFDHFRRCGDGRRECQVLWTSSWERISGISRVVHPRHRAHGAGFELDQIGLNELWLDLSRRHEGIRVQVHTHPAEAFHSIIDDQFPIIHSIGFLSLVIPDFASGPVGLERAFLTEIQPDGTWREVRISSRLEVVR
jgi:hypothetical protein